jgi:CBS domain-containing protein
LISIFLDSSSFLVGVAAAAIMLVIPAYVYHWGPIKEIVILGELLAISAVVMCLLFVTVDMGRPDRAWHMLPFLGTLNFPVAILEAMAMGLPVVSSDGRIEGMVTSWDIAKAVARRLTDLRQITTAPVVTTNADEPIEDAIRKMEDHRISALPVIDAEEKVIGLVTHEAMGSLMGRCK